MLLWNRRPISVLIRNSVHVWSGQPCATVPLASSCLSTVNRASLSLGHDTGPADRSPSVPASYQPRRQRCTERTLTRKSLATSALEAPQRIAPRPPAGSARETPAFQASAHHPADISHNIHIATITHRQPSTTSRRAGQ
jgi:hypothetical protein